MICPHCGDNIIEGFELCPSCGAGLQDQYAYDQQQAEYPQEGGDQYAYDQQQAEYPQEGNDQYAYDQQQEYAPDQAYEEFPADQQYPDGAPGDYGDYPEEEFPASGFSQKTSIVALDPEFQKGTRIVANPMLDNSSRKRARVRAGAPQQPDLPKDEMGKLIYDFKYAYGRMNFLERICLFLFSGTIFLSFAPWITVTSSSRWISGYESVGIYVGIFSLIAGVTLLVKIGMRLPIWATLVHIGAAFLSAIFPLYIYMKKPPEGMEWMVPFYLTLGLSIAAFMVAFAGAMRRFLR